MGSTQVLSLVLFSVAANVTDARAVLYAPRNISGQASQYAAGVRPLGIKAEVWSYGPTAFGFQADRVIDKQRYITDPSYRWSVVDDAVRGFDVFHFQYASSLIIPRGFAAPYLWDIPLLKSLGKKVFMHFRGSDVRLRSMHVQREPESYFLTSSIGCDEEQILGKIDICRRFCDGLFVSTPGLLDYVPDASWVPHAIDPEQWNRPRVAERRIPVVTHVPSRRGTKSSDVVDRILVALQAAGTCTYRPMKSLDHQQLVLALQDADIVVDSLGIGDHGLISVEAMAAGAIAVCHIHPCNRERNPGVPVVEASSETLASVIERLARQPEERRELRQRGLAWVRARHDRACIGRYLAAEYAKPVFEPDVSYPAWPRSETRERVLQLEAQLVRERKARASKGDPRLRPSLQRARSVLPLASRMRKRLARNLYLRRLYQTVRRRALPLLERSRP